MNRRDNQVFRLKQLTDTLESYKPLWGSNRPTGGWLSAFRQALGLSLKSVARPLRVSPQAIHQLEKSEAAGSISLRQLEVVAGAMGCRVAYILLPHHGSLTELANAEKNKALGSVEH